MRGAGLADSVAALLRPSEIRSAVSEWIRLRIGVAGRRDTLFFAQRDVPGSASGRDQVGAGFSIKDELAAVSGFASRQWQRGLVGTGIKLGGCRYRISGSIEPCRGAPGGITTSPDGQDGANAV